MIDEKMVLLGQRIKDRRTELKYTQAELAEVGLDYGSFDDPDEMWMAYLKKLAEDYEMD